MKDVYKPQYGEPEPVSKRVKKGLSSPKYRPILGWGSGWFTTVTLKGLPGKPIHKP